MKKKTIIIRLYDSEPGKRRSKLGKIYYEYRKNRSDMPGEAI